MADDILDKRLIYINSSNAQFMNNTDYDFYFDIQEAIRNAVYIKIMKCEVVLNPSAGAYNAGDGDPIFVNLNNYNRLYTNVLADTNDFNKGGKNVACFEQITLNLSDKFDTASPIPSKFVSFKTEYTATGCTINDTNTYVLDHIESKLNRFNIQLLDKSYNIITKNKINKFTLLLCVYSKNKKSSLV
jgi:hypothetical protein